MAKEHTVTKRLKLKLKIQIKAIQAIQLCAVKVYNALMQINFNGNNFINGRLTQRVFSVWLVAQPIVGEMEIHSANLATLQTPLATFFPSRKRPNIISFLRIAGSAARGLVIPVHARTHISISLSLFLSLSVRQLGFIARLLRSSALS